MWSHDINLFIPGAAKNGCICDISLSKAYFVQYSKRIDNKDTDLCDYCKAETESIIHIFLWLSKNNAYLERIGWLVEYSFITNLAILQIGK